MNLRDIGLYIVIGMYAMSLFEKISDIEGTKKLINMKKLPFPDIALLSAILMLFLGVFGVVLYKMNVVDKYYAVRAIDLLICFTAIATYFFHNMFVDPKQRYYFEKNIAIIGALVYIRQTIN